MNADDFGITWGVNKAIIELAERNMISSTSVMTNMPHYKDILKLSHDTGIGIHFNLTVGRPILPPKMVPTLVNEDGFFFNFPTLKAKFKKGTVSKKEVETEFIAQIERLLKLGCKPDHFNSHQSLIKYPFFYSIIHKIALKFPMRGVRTYTPRNLDYGRLINPINTIKSLYLTYQKRKWIEKGFHVVDKYDSLSQVGLTHSAAIEKLKDIFIHLPVGRFEIIVHPGYVDDKCLLLGKYINEREIERKVLLSNEFKQMLHQYKVELIKFKDIG